MKNNLRIAILFTLITTVLFGVIYPLTVNGLAQLLFPSKANGSLLVKDGHVIGSALLGQPFSSPGCFHSRPSYAGTGYDAAQSSGSNLGPTNHRSEEHTSELQSHSDLVCRLLLEKKNIYSVARFTGSLN